jgi:hypothetical protein
LTLRRQVGQLAKNLFNCKVIGSAGGPDKAALVVRDFGFDACIDYRTVSSTEELYGKLKELAPDGIDMYFENVGGMHFEAAFKALRRGGRIAVCGTISGCVLTPVIPVLARVCMCVCSLVCVARASVSVTVWVCVNFRERVVVIVVVSVLIVVVAAAAVAAAVVAAAVADIFGGGGSGTTILLPLQ